MKINNHLPHFLEGMKRWEKPPGLADFKDTYYRHIEKDCASIFDQAEDLHSVLSDLNWKDYRSDCLKLDPAREEERIRKHLSSITGFFNLDLDGEIVLFSSFTCMDGYARFDQGTHRVFLGVDESHGRGRYLDVLQVHELTHVVRESRPEVWEGFGLNVKMSHDDFTENQPVIEHLMGEGFSCAISEILVPSDEIWHYAYQEKDALKQIMKHSPSVDRVVHAELARGKDGDYGNLYNMSNYRPRLPGLTHYVWAWQWVKQVIADFGDGDPLKVVNRCSKDFIDHALEFKLSSLSGLR